MLYKLNVYSIKEKRGLKMPKTKEQSKELRDKTEALILEKSLECFARHGLADTKISELAKIIGISQGLIYHYFSSKEELFLKIVEQATKNNTENMEQLLQAPMSTKQKIQFLSDRMIDMLLSDKIFSYEMILMIQHALSFTYESELVKGYETGPTKVLIYLIEEGQKSGEVVEGDACALANFYWGAIQGIAFDNILDTSQRPRATADMLNRILIK
jgi:AcrR family transcriptional regulator